MPSTPTQREYYRLYIDESGTSNPLDLQSELYVLAGCSVNKNDCHNIKILADQIKFKYWGKTDVVFHSREISRCEGEFSILKDKNIYNEFLKDLDMFLSSSKFKMFFIIVDKNKARQAGWNDVKVNKDTTLYLVRNFLLTLLTTDSKGEMVIESASAEKDKYLLDAFAFFLGAGITQPKVDYRTIQNTISSVSFVTKKNNDIEEQISDLFGYAAKLNYLKQQKINFKTGLYEDMILELLQKKIFKVPKDASSKKSKFFKQVEPFLILP
jgi:hypothetical protein